MRKKFGFIALGLAVSMSMFGCADKAKEVAENKDTNDKLEIVTTNFPSYDFTRQIIGDEGEVTMLLPPGSESHSYEPTPQDIISIEKADIFIYTGGEGDQWVDNILSSIENDDIKIIRMIDTVELLEEEIVEGMTHEHEHSHDEHGEEDHEHDHEEEHAEENHEHEEHEHEEEGEGMHEHEEHAEEDHEHEEHADEDHEHEGHEHEGEREYDEHVWTSPVNAIKIVSAISEAVILEDESNASVYKENTRNYIDELGKLDKTFREITDSAKRHEVIFADRFPIRYFVEEYDLEYYAAFPGCAADGEPSAATVAFLIDKVEEDNIPVVFHIELSNEKMADTIVEATGAKKLLFSAAHNVTKDEFEAGITYLEIMNDNAETLKEALN